MFTSRLFGSVDRHGVPGGANRRLRPSTHGTRRGTRSHHYLFIVSQPPPALAAIVS